jgi:predicted nuclease of predicted toxin-antitoxin system
MLHKLLELSFLTDENIQPEVVDYLRQRGFDVVDVKELNFYGKTDEFLFSYATGQQRVIISHDSDFGRLLFTGNLTFSGIIYLRPGHLKPEISIFSLKSLFEQHIEINFPFIITIENNLEKVKIRIREL